MTNRRDTMGPIARRAAGQEDALAALRAEYEGSDEYRIGCALLDGLTQELGISAEEAAAMLLGGERPAGVEVLSARAAQTLAALEAKGALARPAAEYIADPAFAELLRTMPAEAAVRLYDAERTARGAGEEVNRARAEAEAAVLETLRAQRALPAQTRSAIPATATPDFSAMTSEEFEAFKRRYLAQR